MKDNRNFKKTNNKKMYRSVNKKARNEKPKAIKNEEEREFSDQIEGRNSVLELLESGKDVNKIFIEKGEKHGSINKIIGIAKDRKIVIVEVDRNKLNQMAESENHQGVIAIVPPFDYCEVDDILAEVTKREEAPLRLLEYME